MDFKLLVTQLAIVNPLAIAPFFIHYTLGFSKAQKQHPILMPSFSAFVVIAVSALLGLILAALAVEAMANGLGKLFPLLMRA